MSSVGINRFFLMGIEEELDAMSTGMNLDDAMDAIEGAFVRFALVNTTGCLTEAAKVLGVKYRSIRYRVQKLGIDAGRDTNDQWRLDTGQQWWQEPIEDLLED